MGRASFYYAVATRTGCGIFRTWDECLAFLHVHPGAEFHKKHRTWVDAEAFMIDKCKELGYQYQEAQLEQRLQSHSVALDSDGILNTDTSTDAVSEDDAPPW